MLRLGWSVVALAFGLGAVAMGANRNKEYQVTRLVANNGSLARTIVLPKGINGEDATQRPFFDPPDDNYVLVSDSRSSSLGRSSSPAKKSPVEEWLKENPPLGRTATPRRRRRKFNATAPAPTAASVPAHDSRGQTQLEQSHFANDKNAKFLNLFTIIQFPNDACSDDGGTCYHELECNSIGGVPGARCARGFGVCCMVEATCGARTNINNTVFIGSETNLGSCSLSIDKAACTKQLRLDFINFEMDPPFDGECVRDRLFVSGANKNVVVPVLCGSLTGQHMYLDVDEVTGPVVLNMVSGKPGFRIKVTHMCEGNDMLAPKNCLQYHKGKSGVIRSFNYHTSSTASSYFNNLNYAICIGREPETCSISYSNETPDGGEFEFDMVNLDDDGSPSVPPRQAGAEVFNCPDDFISISSIRLCGQKLNDGMIQVDFTKNYPIVDSTRGPFIMTVRTDESVTGKGFYMNYQQKSC